MRLGVRLALLCGVAVLGYPPVLAADVLPTCTNEFDEEYGAGYCGARKENCAHPIFKDKCKRTCENCGDSLDPRDLDTDLDTEPTPAEQESAALAQKPRAEEEPINDDDATGYTLTHLASVHGAGVTFRPGVLNNPLEERALVIVRPSVLEDNTRAFVPVLERRIRAMGLEIRQRVMTHISSHDVRLLYEEQLNEPHFSEVVHELTTKRSLLMSVKGPNAVKKWLRLMGPEDLAVARRDAPDSLRARFAHDQTFNGFFGSRTKVQALRHLRLLFHVLV